MDRGHLGHMDLARERDHPAELSVHPAVAWARKHLQCMANRTMAEQQTQSKMRVSIHPRTGAQQCCVVECRVRMNAIQCVLLNAV